MVGLIARHMPMSIDQASDTDNGKGCPACRSARYHGEMASIVEMKKIIKRTSPGLGTSCPPGSRSRRWAA
jgi:hypothetical protein